MQLLTHRVLLVTAAMILLLLVVAVFPIGLIFMLANLIWAGLLVYLVLVTLKDKGA
jgi:hypothetical protein